VLGLLAALATVNAIPSIGRQYQTEQPYSVFHILVATSLLIGWLALICAAAVVLVLFFAARPGWRRSLRRESLGGALARAAVAALALAGLARWGRVLSGGVPALFEADPSLPQALERAVPAFAALWSTVTSTFGLAALAAVLALAAPHDLFRRPAGRAAGALVLLLSLLPTGFRSPGQFAAELASSVVAAAVMAAVAFLYLSDSAAAWVLFGALAFGGRAAAELLWQPAAEDRAAGWAALGLILLAVAALLARIPGRKDAVPAAAPGAASGFP
jgi:hypothetical protein